MKVKIIMEKEGEEPLVMTVEGPDAFFVETMGIVMEQLKGLFR